jgi:hypothetical protein
VIDIKALDGCHKLKGIKWLEEIKVMVHHALMNIESASRPRGDFDD